MLMKILPNFSWFYLLQELKLHRGRLQQRQLHEYEMHCITLRMFWVSTSIYWSCWLLMSFLLDMMVAKIYTIFCSVVMFVLVFIVLLMYPLSLVAVLFYLVLLILSFVMFCFTSIVWVLINLLSSVVLLLYLALLYYHLGFIRSKLSDGKSLL